MRVILIAFGLVSLLSCVIAAPVSSDPALSCARVNPILAHDGRGFNIFAPMIDGADRVDAHFELDGVHDVFNVRLIPSSTETGMYELPESIEGHEHSPISYHLTYMSDDARACDTHQFQADNVPAAAPTASSASASASAPAPALAPAPAAAAAPEEAACSLPAIQHEVMRNDAGQYFVQVMGRQPYTYIDLHATIGSSPETNIRIARNIATAQSTPFTIPAGEGLQYWLTYAIDDTTCSTGMYATGPLN